MTGVHWDISWHRSIGRDSFWTPAHIDIYFCGVLAGISCGYLILSTTLQAASPLRESSVTLWGFRGPLGAFVAAWGGIAMLTSAPFDDWWHAAYGLDVKILSPPHMVLAAGMIAVQLGALILILGRMNRARGRGARAPESALPVRRRDDSGLPHGAADGTYLPQPDAHGALLSSAGDGGAAGAGGDGARQRIPLGGHHGGGRLQRLPAADGLDSAAVPGAAETRSGVSTGHAVHAARISRCC